MKVGRAAWQGNTIHSDRRGSSAAVDVRFFEAHDCGSADRVAHLNFHRNRNEVHPSVQHAGEATLVGPLDNSRKIQAVGGSGNGDS